MIRDDLSRSELIRPGLAVQVDPVRLLYLPFYNTTSILYSVWNVLLLDWESAVKRKWTGGDKIKNKGKMHWWKTSFRIRWWKCTSASTCFGQQVENTSEQYCNLVVMANHYIIHTLVNLIPDWRVPLFGPVSEFVLSMLNNGRTTCFP